MGLLGKFADSLDYNDLPKGWADNPEIVEAAGELYRDMGTESPFFKAWFGNSKVVDDAGKPLTTYHGTTHDFTSFNKDMNFTSPSAQYADRYTEGRGMIYPLFTRMEHPFDTRKTLPHSIFYNKFRPEYGASRLADDTKLPDWTDADDLKDFLGDQYSGKYDGLMLTEPDPGGAGRISFATFSPSSLKSKFNRGTFNPADPNIYKALPWTAGGAGTAAALAPGEAYASVPADQYRFPADEPGYVNREPGLETPLVDVADLAVAPIGAATAAGRAAAVAAEPFIAYGMDKAGNWLGNKVNGLLGYFGWGE